MINILGYIAIKDQIDLRALEIVFVRDVQIG